MQFELHGWVYILANIFCALLCVPVITAPAAFAGLSYLSHSAQTGPTVHPDYFWVGLRKHFRHGLLMGLANALLLTMLITNLNAYAGRSSLLFVSLRLIWLGTLGTWLCVQLYLWPMMEEMEQPTLRGALRNSALMALQNPLFTLTLLILILVTTILSALIVVPLVMITLSIIACTVNVAVLDRLARYRTARQQSTS